MNTLFTTEQIKQLTDVYPFLVPRNVWTGKVVEGYDYSYIVSDCCLPEGWERLFLMYCRNIYPLLVADDYINEFRFSEIKEKYGTMRLYNFGQPRSFGYITTVFEHLSYDICQRCGKPAKYATIGWVESLCESCFDGSETVDKIIQHRTYKIITYEDGIKNVITIPLTPLRKEYRKILKMSADQLFNYMMEVRSDVKEESGS